MGMMMLLINYRQRGSQRVLDTFLTNYKEVDFN